MRHKSNYLSSLSLTMAVLGMLTFLLALEGVTHSYDRLSLNILPLMLLLFIAIFLDGMLISHKANMTVFAILQILFLAGGVLLFLTFLQMEPVQFATKIFFCFVYAGMFLLAAYISWLPVEMSHVIGCFDVMALMVMVTLALSRREGSILLTESCLLSFLAMRLSLFTLIMMRTEQVEEKGGILGSAHAGRFMMIGLLLIITVFALILAVLSAGGSYYAGSAVAHVLQKGGAGFSSLLSLIYQKAEAFFTWLFSLLHLQMPKAVAESSDSAGSMTSQVAESGQILIPVWIKAAGFATLIFLFLLFLYKIRSFRFEKRMQEERRANISVEKSGSRGAYYKNMLGKMIFYIRFRAECYQKRNTTEGKFLSIERKYRKKFPRKAGQSGPEYLRMLAELEVEDKEKFLVLAEELEKALYAKRLV